MPCWRLARLHLEGVVEAPGGPSAEASDDRVDVFGYRLHGLEGWRVSATKAGVAAAIDARRAAGAPVASVRLITSSRGVHPSKSASELIDHDRLIGAGWKWDGAIDAWRAPGETVAEPPRDPVQVDAVRVAFDPAHYGWQPVRIEAGGATLRFSASNIFDPFPQILRWLCRLLDDESARVAVNLEGGFLEFHAWPSPDGRWVRLVAAYAGGSRETFGDVALDIRCRPEGFARAFYCAFRAYALSGRYDPTHWAPRTLRDEIEQLAAPVSLHRLARQSAESLNTLFWAAYPSYEVSFPAAASEGEELVRFAESVMNGDAPDDAPEDAQYTPSPEFEVPEDFADRPLGERLLILQEMLDEPVNGWFGEDLRALEDPVLERLLRDCRAG